MILKKLFSVYSPVWQLIFALTAISGLAAIYQAYILQHPQAALITSANSTATYTGDLQLNAAFFLPVLIGLISVTAYAIVCHKHNSKKGSHKVNPFSLRPNEVIGDDERMQQASANAALKLYIGNHFSLPFLAIIMTIGAGSGSVQMTALGFMIFIAGYYLVYLGAMWPYLGED